MQSFVQPNFLSQALALRAEGARLLAGGTDFWPAELTNPPARSPKTMVVDLGTIAALRGVDKAADGSWRIGATTTWSEVAAATLPPVFAGLQAAAREVGGPQIQNRGTIAGNLCNASPAADGVPPLLALDARVELASTHATRLLPLSAFVLGPRRTALRADEIVTAIVIPPQTRETRSAFLKLGARRYLLISIVMTAAVVEIADGRAAAARVAVGACSPVAVRLSALEAALAGMPIRDLGRVVSPAHLGDLAPIDDVRADAAYRRDAALVAVRRVLEQIGAVP